MYSNRCSQYYEHGVFTCRWGVLFRTTNGGATWTDITSILPHSAKGFCGITHVGNQVHVVGRYTGQIADYFFSTDGGNNWRWRDLRDIAQGLVDVAFVSKTVG